MALHRGTLVPSARTAWQLPEAMAANLRFLGQVGQAGQRASEPARQRASRGGRPDLWAARQGHLKVAETAKT